MLNKLVDRLRTSRSKNADATDGPPADSMELGFPSCIARQFPDQFKNAWRAIESVIAAEEGAGFEKLELHSPSLKGFDWGGYLRLSVIRMLFAFDRLKKAGFSSGRVLDFGSYFGNFALMLAREGYQVDAVDFYRAYGNGLSSVVELLQCSGVRVLDFGDAGTNLRTMEPATYDSVFCMGVIEHIPHTPREVLESIDRVLKPGGVLVLDTPNLAYVYNRQKLLRGESIFTPIQCQYSTEIPFEGHHREYTISEVKWIVNELGHQLLSIETFNYSLFALGNLRGQDLINYRLMEEDPTCREIILALSRKPSLCL
jgi:2-polyprenyl-3-methyl-5-hydroxy-6-metoxy-1,4-benzoquinol methylase